VYNLTVQDSAVQDLVACSNSQDPGVGPSLVRPYITPNFKDAFLSHKSFEEEVLKWNMLVACVACHVAVRTYGGLISLLISCTFTN
jgi:hypothetical protein